MKSLPVLLLLKQADEEETTTGEKEVRTKVAVERNNHVQSLAPL